MTRRLISEENTIVDHEPPRTHLKGAEEIDDYIAPVSPLTMVRW